MANTSEGSSEEGEIVCFVKRVDNGEHECFASVKEAQAWIRFFEPIYGEGMTVTKCDAYGIPLGAEQSPEHIFQRKLLSGEFRSKVDRERAIAVLRAAKRARESNDRALVHMERQRELWLGKLDLGSLDKPSGAAVLAYLSQYKLTVKEKRKILRRAIYELDKGAKKQRKK